jgi:hypothetical protein
MTADEPAKCIPDEAVMALQDSLAEYAGVLVPACYCRVAIAAVIAAWPNAVTFTPHTAKWPEKPSIILPLQETPNAE